MLKDNVLFRQFHAARVLPSNPINDIVDIEINVPMEATPFIRSCLVVLRKYFSKQRTTEIGLSHSHVVTGVVAAIFKGCIRPHLHGNGSMWNRTRTVRIGLAFTRELMEPFYTEPLAVPELVHLESRSRTEPNRKFLV